MSQITSEPFKFEVFQESSTVIVVRVSGAFRRGNGEYSDFIRFYAELQNLQKQAMRSLILFDLTNLTFWDTMGIHKIVGWVVDITKRFGSKAGLFGNKKELILMPAKLKYPELGTKRLPWEDTKEELIKALTE